MPRLVRLAAGISLLWSSVSLSALELAPVFGPGLIWQARQPVIVWGTGVPEGAEVRVSLGGVEVGRGVARADRTWEVVTAPQDYRPGHTATTLRVTAGRAAVERPGVRVGEVWLCVGQSNMRFRLGRLAEPRRPEDPRLYPETLARAADPRLQLLNVSGGTPRNRAWAAADPHSAEEFSAVGFHFGQFLADRLGVPVGLVDLGMGGLPLRGFLPADAADSQSPWGQALGGIDDRTDRIYTRDFRWFAPYAVAGVLWYQGESDRGRAASYRTAFTGLLEIWRRDLRRPDLPFLVVPTTPYEGRPSAERIPAPRDGAPIRAVLQELESLPQVWAIPSADLGERHDIHPRRKREVGERLARAALAEVYGHAVRWQGPRPDRIERDSAGWTLHLRGAEGGLVVTADALTGFEVETSPGEWVAVAAEVSGPSTIRLRPPAPIPTSGAVRYGWWSWFVPTVSNGDGFPLGPFQLD